ncbi:MAG: hypothetical protein R3F31_09730 [Verrucomicrobiales bacterium]
MTGLTRYFRLPPKARPALPPPWEAGYTSIGDWHTSHKLTDGMSPEEARFFGLKRECGLHESTDFVI